MQTRTELRQGADTIFKARRGAQEKPVLKHLDIGLPASRTVRNKLVI
jgi:hypothetical protein